MPFSYLEAVGVACDNLNITTSKPNRRGDHRTVNIDLPWQCSCRCVAARAGKRTSARTFAGKDTLSDSWQVAVSNAQAEAIVPCGVRTRASTEGSLESST